MQQVNKLDLDLLHASAEAFDLICLSHLRWDFVYQRPQHLMSRFGAQGRVFYIEEPVFDGGPARYDLRSRENNIWVATPHLPAGLSAVDVVHEQIRLTLARQECSWNRPTRPVFHTRALVSLASLTNAWISRCSRAWLKLAQNSWDCTWSDMRQLLDTVISRPNLVSNEKKMVWQKDETICSII